jgi:hypothetical protein
MRYDLSVEMTIGSLTPALLSPVTLEFSKCKTELRVVVCVTQRSIEKYQTQRWGKQ